MLTFRNTGNATLTVSSVTSSNARFAAVSLGTPFNIGAGSSQTANIRFASTATGSQTGRLTIASTDPARPSLTVSMSGLATGGAPATPLTLTECGWLAQWSDIQPTPAARDRRQHQHLYVDHGVVQLRGALILRRIPCRLHRRQSHPHL